MTMPSERARALRWAGEFLEKLNRIDGVDRPDEIKREISTILRHYPSASSIANEAKFQSFAAASSSRARPSSIIAMISRMQSAPQARASST